MLYENFRDSYGMATETALEGLRDATYQLLDFPVALFPHL